MIVFKVKCFVVFSGVVDGRNYFVINLDEVYFKWGYVDSLRVVEWLNFNEVINVVVWSGVFIGMCV